MSGKNLFGFDIEYPKTCTNKHWQKQKSLKDKVMSSTKTGLGTALDKAEASWGKINFARLHPGMSKAAEMTADVDYILKAKAFAVGSNGIVSQAAKDLNFAVAKATAVSKDKKISKDAAAAAGQIATELSKLSAGLTSFDPAKAFDANAAAAQKQVDKAKSEFKKGLLEAARMFKVFALAPAPDDFGSQVKELSNKGFSPMLGAITLLSQMSGKQAGDWAAASKTVRKIEGMIGAVMKVASDAKAEDDKRKKAIQTFAKAGGSELAALQKLA